ncbi:MAG: DUF1992 domain-containing protein [Zoogloeaceae bacterium]|nr:DUF1992 domain-containing protein [Zoogloeaceae bacterium]
MGILDQQAEERIRLAMSRGEFANLPGAGLPLVLDVEPLVPEEVRMVHHVLRNAGCLPPQIQAAKDATKLAEEAVGSSSGRGQHLAMCKLNLMLTALVAQGQGQMATNVLARYRHKLIDKLSR